MTAVAPQAPGDALAALDDEQRRAAEAVSGPVCILAGAGTGKTRTVTHRIAHAIRTGATAAEHVLAVTFTQRAAGELRERLTALGVAAVQARTFHAAALRQLQHFWPETVGGRPPSLLDHKARVVAQAAARVGVPTDRATVRDLAAEIEWAKVGLVTIEGYPVAAAAAGRIDVAGLAPDTVARVMDAYEREKDGAGYIDFEDVLLLTTGLLEQHDSVARQVRSRYRWFTVDEYQDVSAVQERLLRAWVGQRRDLCVVGDPNQTIYSFAGADPSLLTGFAARYPGSTVVRLTHNYRSTEGVVALGNAVLGGAGHALVSVRGAPDGTGPLPGPAGEVAFHEHDDEVAEADAVAAQIAMTLARSVPATDIAVLVRTNGQLELFEDALSQRDIPYVVRGGERFFAREEVRRAVTMLRGAAKAATGEPAGSTDVVAATRDVLSGLGWSEVAPSARGNVRQRWESLAALVSQAERLAADRPGAGLADLVADLDARAAAQHAPRADAVTLATLHAAKGLEWPVVHLPGLTEGTLPISFASTPAAVAEERRLLYVGVTRARDAVRLSWARARTPGARGGRRPSRFLDGIRPADTGQAAAARPAAAVPVTAPVVTTPVRPVGCLSCGVPLATAAQRTARRCATCPPRYDAAVFGALHEWRAATARASGVPAYIVFSDATLEAVAEAAPADLDGLARVPGVGAVKLGRYGPEVLAVVAASH